MRENKNISGAVKYLQKAAVGTGLLTVSASFAFTPLAGTLEASAVEQSSYSVMTKSLSSHSYSDVQADHPAYESIQYVATNNLFGDGGTGKFSPSYPVYADMIVTSTAKVFGFSAENASDARLSLARAGFPFLLGNDKVTTYMSSQQFVLGLAYLVDGKEYTDVDKALKLLNTKKIIIVGQESGKTLSESFFTDDVFTRSEFAILITRIANLAPTTNDTVLETFSKNANKTIAQLEKDGPAAPSSGVSTYYDKDTKRNEPKLSSDDPNNWTQEDYNNEITRINYEKKLFKKKKLPSTGYLGTIAKYDGTNNTLKYYGSFRVANKTKNYFLYKAHIIKDEKVLTDKVSAVIKTTSISNTNNLNLSTIEKVSSSSLPIKERTLLNTLSKNGFIYIYDSTNKSLSFTDKKIKSLSELLYDSEIYTENSFTKNGFILNIPRSLSNNSVKKIIQSYVDSNMLPKNSVNHYYNIYMKMKKGAKLYKKGDMMYESNSQNIVFSYKRF